MEIGNNIDYSVGGSVSDAVSEVTEYANAKRMILTEAGIQAVK